MPAKPCLTSSATSKTQKDQSFGEVTQKPNTQLYGRPHADYSLIVQSSPHEVDVSCGTKKIFQNQV